MPTSRKQVLKRFYYVWDSIKNAMPIIKEYGIGSIEDLYAKVKDDATLVESISPITVMCADYASSKIDENLSHTITPDIMFVVESFTNRCWFMVDRQPFCE